MLQSLMIKLESTEGDKVRLLETMRKYNRAANFVAEKAFDLKSANKNILQMREYRQLDFLVSLYNNFLYLSYNRENIQKSPL
jgi:predicted transposase